MEHENVTVALVTSPGKHAREVSACQSFEFFWFKGIGFDMVASVNVGSWWIWWFILSEGWIGWRPCGSDALSGSLDPAHDGGDGLFKVFADWW